MLSKAVAKVKDTSDEGFKSCGDNDRERFVLTHRH
jgi:hypothetical protein